MTRRTAVAMTILALVIGCSDDGGDNQGPPGRGTPACNKWQSAICGWASKCPVQGGATCDQVKGIACKSDAEAERCATAIASATCQTPPANCDLRDMADPAPAQKACNDYVALACDWSEQCQAGTRDACLQKAKEVLDCSLFIGVTLAYEQCVSELPKHPCTDTAGPASCKGVLLK